MEETLESYLYVEPVNDLAMSGAKPLYITVGFIIEEGLELKDLERIVKSISETANEANVKIVAGDTKVVEKEVEIKYTLIQQGLV